MESKLFSWKGWGGDIGRLTFTDCVLKQNVHQFTRGQSFPAIVLDLEKGEIEFHHENGGILVFELSYAIGPINRVRLANEVN